MTELSFSRAETLERLPWLCDDVFATWLVRMLAPYGSSILDVGCGSGYMFGHYEESFKRVGAIEPSPAFADVLFHRSAEHGVEAKRASAEAIPFGDDSFDVVLAKSSLHHFADARGGLLEMARVAANAVAAVEVIAPDERCVPFLTELLMEKEEGRNPASVFTLTSLRSCVCGVVKPNAIRCELFDQYIDLEAWLANSDLSEEGKRNVLRHALAMPPKVAEKMQLHVRFGRHVMLRRMCLVTAVVGSSDSDSCKGGQ